MLKQVHLQISQCHCWALKGGFQIKKLQEKKKQLKTGQKVLRVLRMRGFLTDAIFKYAQSTVTLMKTGSMAGLKIYLRISKEIPQKETMLEGKALLLFLLLCIHFKGDAPLPFPKTSSTLHKKKKKKPSKKLINQLQQQSTSGEKTHKVWFQRFQVLKVFVIKHYFQVLNWLNENESWRLASSDAEYLLHYTKQKLLNNTEEILCTIATAFKAVQHIIPAAWKLQVVFTRHILKSRLSFFK